MRLDYTIDDLKNWESRCAEAGAPLKLGVVGHPVGHSLSPVFHNAALAHDKRDERYVRLEIAPEQFSEAVAAARQAGFIGLNVTIPHKQAAAALCDHLDATAGLIGAANTLHFRPDGIYGFNTDAPAFSRVVREEFGVDLRDLRVLILGVGGGAGRALATQCALESCERLILVNRSPEKAAELARALSGRFGGAKVDGPSARLAARAWTEASLAEELETIDLLVNATSLGLRSGDDPVLPHSLLPPHLLVFDTVYGKGRTPLVEAARRNGARAIDGTAMLLEQGALAYEIWFGGTAPRSVFKSAIAAV